MPVVRRKVLFRFEMASVRRYDNFARNQFFYKSPSAESAIARIAQSAPGRFLVFCVDSVDCPTKVRELFPNVHAR